METLESQDVLNISAEVQLWSKVLEFDKCGCSFGKVMNEKVHNLTETLNHMSSTFVEERKEWKKDLDRMSSVFAEERKEWKKDMSILTNRFYWGILVVIIMSVLVGIDVTKALWGIPH